MAENANTPRGGFPKSPGRGENLAGRPNERTGRGENLAQERLECWDEVAELFGPPIVPLSDHTSSVVGASLTS